jgi:hypothetical protein
MASAAPARPDHLGALAVVDAELQGRPAVALRQPCGDLGPFLPAPPDAQVTLTVVVEEVDGAKRESPEYRTLSERCPFAVGVQVIVALPPTRVAVVATGSGPSYSRTVPVAAPVPLPVTVTENDVAFPNFVVRGAANVVVEVAPARVTEAVAELGRRVALPPYAAFTVCVPRVSVVTRTARPWASSAAVPRVVVPSENVTDPAATADPPVTVAVRVVWSGPLAVAVRAVVDATGWVLVPEAFQRSRARSG